MRPVRRLPVILAAVALMLCALAPAAPALAAEEPAAEWPGFRGPQRDGSVRDASLFGDGEAGLTLGWRTPLGPGYSAVAVSGDRLVTLYSDGERDVAAAFDTESGKLLWRYDMGETYKGHDGSHDGPIATPLIDGGRVYGFGPRGQMFALDLATGAAVWTRQAGEDVTATEPFYGYSSSPMLVDGTLVVAVGGEEGKAVAGLDPATGETRWQAGDDAINYQSPVALPIGKKLQVVVAGDKKLFGLDPKSGDLLWEYEHQGDQRATGSASINPVPAGDGRLLLTYKSDAAVMLQLKPGKGGKVAVEELWTAETFKSTYVTPVYHDGYLYGVNGRVLTCLNADTGELVWRSREPGDGFLTLVGDHLVIQTKAGSVHVAPASPEGYNEVASLKLFEDVSWSEVAYAGGHLYARGMDGLARINPGRDVAAAAGAGAAAAVIGSQFAAFLDEVAAADDKAAVVDAWMQRQDSFPVLEAPDLVHFVYRGEAEDMGMEGDLHGARREEPLTHVPGTDLFYLTARLEPDARLGYRFIKDYEERLLDPRNPRQEPGYGLMRGDVSWFTMPGWRQPDHTREAVGLKGRSESQEVKATFGEAEQPISLSVYLPAAYDSATDSRFPVLYTHGEAEDLELLGLPAAMDNLAGDAMEPTILVLIAISEELAQQLQGPEMEAAYAAAVADVVVPFIDRTYRTRTDVFSRGQIGVGFSAPPAVKLTLARPDLFGLLALQSAALFGADATAAMEGLRAAGEQPLRIYQSWGTYDLRSPHEAWDMAAANRSLREALHQHGYKPAGGERPTGFGWGCWRDQLGESLTVLFPAPRPAR